jgi:hypothetical protein
MTWNVEPIPNEDRLFYRVNAKLLKDRLTLHSGVFREQHGSISTDWEKYSTPDETRNRAAVPDDNGVVALVVGAVRAFEGLSVLHSPDEQRQNRAHSDILGLDKLDAIKKNEARLMLLNHVRSIGWVISPKITSP